MPLQRENEANWALTELNKLLLVKARQDSPSAWDANNITGSLLLAKAKAQAAQVKLVSLQLEVTNGMWLGADAGMGARLTTLAAALAAAIAAAIAAA